MKSKPSKPSKKDFQRQIGEMGNGLNFLFQELGRLKGNLGGLENIIMFYAEFKNERAEFEKFLEDKIKEQEKEDAKSKDLADSNSNNKNK